MITTKKECIKGGHNSNKRGKTVAGRPFKNNHNVVAAVWHILNGKSCPRSTRIAKFGRNGIKSENLLKSGLLPKIEIARLLLLSYEYVTSGGYTARR